MLSENPFKMPSSDLAAAAKRIIVALDVASASEALRLVNLFGDRVGGVKLGLELLMSTGPALADEIAALGVPVFLDGKFMDIPNTVAGAVRAATRHRVCMMNVHCFGGRAMMRAAAEAARTEAERLGSVRPLVLGVTVLTSISSAALHEELGVLAELEAQVLHLANAAVESGLDGIICSPNEAAALRKSLPRDVLIVTPGVRPRWSVKNDQERVTTPGAAVRAGADALVIGRPITNPPNSVGGSLEAVSLISDEIAAAI